MCKRNLIVFILLLYSLQTTWANHHSTTVDSLKQLLNNDISTDEQLRVYYQLGNLLLENEPSQAFEYSNSLRDLAAQSNNTYFLVQGMLQLCDFYLLIGEYATAFDLAYKSLEYSKANLELMSHCHNRLANIHSSLSNYKESLYHNNKSLKYNSERKDSSAIMLDIHNIAVDYTDLEMFDSALKYLRKTNAYELKRTGKPDTYSLSNMGNVYLYRNQLDSALLFHLQAYKYDQENNRRYLVSLDEQFLAQTYFKMADYPKAQQYALQSLKRALAMNANNIILDNYELLHKIKEKNNEYEEAYKYLTKLNALRDSVYTSSKQKLVLGLEANYKMLEQNEQLNILTRQKKLYRLLALLSILFIVSLSVLIILIYRRHITYRKLLKELKLSDSSKEKLLSIISHDLRGSVGALRTASKAIGDGITDLEDTRDLMKSFFPVADSIYDLLENLLIWAKCNREEITPIIETLNMSEIVEKSLEHLHHLALSKRVSINNEINGVEIRADRNMMLSVVRNLLSNAIKFSHPNSTVSIKQRIKDDVLVVAVEDKGIGIEEQSLNKLFTAPEEVQASGTVGERGSGLGLGICKTFLESQGGVICAESKPNEGTTIYFSIPLDQ